MTRLTAFLLVVSLLGLTSIGTSAENPGKENFQRIASMSLCSDELLLLLADPTRIISLSYLSADPRYSTFSEDVPPIFLNHGQAEEIIPLNPDLIVSSRFSAGTAVRLLQGLGYSVNSLGFPASLQGVFQQIEDFADLINEREKGAQLVQELQSHISEVQNTLDTEQQLSAVFYANNGISFGQHTLRDDFLNSLGISNLAAEKKLSGTGMLPIETVIAADPDFLILDQADSHATKLAQPLLQHPALQQLFPAEKIIVLPDTLFQCAGPGLMEAYTIMAQALRKME